MADKVQIVPVNDKGQFKLDLPQSQVARIDVIDIDLVVTTKDGDRIILPSAAIDAMGPQPPAIQFADGAMSTVDMLAAVDKVETPPVSIPAMTSLTAYDPKHRDDKPAADRKTADVPAAEQQAPSPEQQQAKDGAPLQTEGSESTVDKLVAKAAAMESEIIKKAFDPAPIKAFEPPPNNPDAPGSQPPTSKIPLMMALAEGNAVGIDDSGVSLRGGKIILGSGGPSGSSVDDGILPGDPAQYGREVLTGTAAGDEIYADGFYKSGFGARNPAATFTGNHLDVDTGISDGTPLYYAKEFMFGVAGYLRRLDSVTISIKTLSGAAVPGISIEGATANADGTWTLPNDKVVPVAGSFTVVYDVAQVRNLGDVYMSYQVKGLGSKEINQTRSFVLRFLDVDESSDVTNNTPIFVQGAWTDIYVMPTASAPHQIDAGAGDNLIYAGNSADTITAAAGNDTIYAYAGNDTIHAGSGTNTIFAGNGNDVVTSGTGGDRIELGGGANTLIDDGGNNLVLAKGSGSSAKDVITIGSAATTSDNIIFVGNEATSYASVSGLWPATGMAMPAGLEPDGDPSGDSDGNDTVTTFGGRDLINVGDGDNKVTAGINSTAGLSSALNKKVIYAGSGNDIITTGNGDDTISAGSGNNIVDAGSGNNRITGLGGSDTVSAGAGSDVIDVGNGPRNIVWAGDGTNEIIAGSGNDQLIGGSGIDSIAAGDGDDWLYGGTGLNNTANNGGLDGGSGTDWLSFNGIDRTALLNGTATLTDWLSYSGTAIATGVSLQLDASGSGTATRGGETDTVTGIENLIGSQYDDTLDVSLFTGQGHTLYGLDGDDILLGSDDDDALYGGAGDDQLTGGSGDDLIYTGITGIAGVAVSGTPADQAISGSNPGTLSYVGGSSITFTNLSNIADGEGGADTLVGGSGDDYFVGAAGQHGAGTRIDSFDGGSGTDTVDHGTYTTNMVIDLPNGLATTGGVQIANYTSIERLISGTGNDTITGSSGGDTVYGNSGDDTFYSNGGNDVFYGGASSNNGNAGDRFYSSNVSGTTTQMHGEAGFNFYYLQRGNDVVIGGDDTDRIDYGATSGSGVVVNLSNSAWTGQIWNGSSFVAPSSAFTVAAASGSGFTSAGLNANTGSDRYRAIGDNVTESKIEQVWGTNAADVMIGNSLNNYFSAGNGNDALYGMAGNDTFDFSSGSDYIDGGGTYVGGGGAGTAVTMTTTGVTGGDTVTCSNQNTAFNVVMSSDADGTGSPGAITYTVAGVLTTVRIVGIENFIGGNMGDIVTGTADGNYIYGGAGNDTITGGGGDDVINLGGNYAGNALSGRDEADADGGSGAVAGVAGTQDWVSYLGLGSWDGTNGVAGVELHLEQAETAAKQAAGWSQYARVRIDSSNYDIDDLKNFENAQGSDKDDTIYGSTGANTLWGMSGADTIYGGGGNDVIDGGAGNDILDGGSGADVLTGGGGNDTYYLDDAGDVITAEASGNGTGTDWVYASVSHTLGANIEHLVGTGSTGLTLTGNTTNNSIVGTAGDDVIDGSTGADTLTGGAGNDTYYVDNTGDLVTEAGSAGTDRVYASINYTLTSNVENLIGTGATGLTLTGNTLNNAITGTTGNDTINGGTGADAMTGGQGNDLYYVDNVGDTVTEAAGEGTDRISTSVSYTLSAEVENLTGTGSTGLTLTGNALDNSISGTTGADVIDGGGGADAMTGGGGNDTYYVDNAGDLITEAGSAGTDLVYTSINYTLTSNVENLTGTGSTGLSLTGTSAANVITGTSGDDIITGGGGADSLTGNGGNDTFVMTSAQLSAATLVSGGAQNTADTLQVTDNWTMSNVSTYLTKLSSVEAINLDNGGAAVTISALSNAILSGILDGSATKLTLYLDTGDTFNYANSTLGAGSYTGALNDVRTYTYNGGTNLQLEVHWA